MLEGRCHCGKSGWRFEAEPEDATACNCTICRRYGVLWIYGHEGGDVHVTGPVRSYRRTDTAAPALEFLFCPDCACVLAWRGLGRGEDGRKRAAVNLRLTEPGPVAHLPVLHFDGLERFDDLPRDGRCVADMWF
ncbi:MAG: GFA family protein [Paracoccaceae bacterium]